MKITSLVWYMVLILNLPSLSYGESQAANHPGTMEHANSESCDDVFVNIAKQYLTQHSSLLSIYVNMLNDSSGLDIKSLKLVFKTDLDQGSRSLRREVEFVNSSGDRVILYTQGDLFCSDESVLGIAKIIMKKRGHHAVNLGDTATSECRL